MPLWTALSFKIDSSCVVHYDSEEEYIDCSSDCVRFKPIITCRSACDIITSFVKYGKNRIQALAIGLPELNDTILETIAVNCIFLKRFELKLPDSFCNQLLHQNHHYLTEVGLMAFFRNVSLLTHLEISGGESPELDTLSVYKSLITSNIFRIIEERGFQLEAFCLKVCQVVMSFPTLRWGESTLRFLWLGDSDVHFFSSFCDYCRGFPSFFQNMTKLRIHPCPFLLDNHLIVIVSAMRSLQYLEIRNNDFLTDQGIRAVAQNCTQLRSLCVSRLSRITVEGIRAVLTSCCDLVELNISFSSVFTAEDIASFIEMGPSLVFLYCSLAGFSKTVFLSEFSMKPSLFLIDVTAGLVSRTDISKKQQQLYCVKQILHRQKKPWEKICCFAYEKYTNEVLDMIREII